MQEDLSLSRDQKVSDPEEVGRWTLARWFSSSHLESDYQRLDRSGLTIERSARIGGAQFLLGGIGMALIFPFVHPTGPIGDVGWILAYLGVLTAVVFGVWQLRTPVVTPSAQLTGVYAALFTITMGTWLTDGKVPLVLLLVISAQHWAVHPPRRMVPVATLAVLCALSPLLYTDHVGGIPYEWILAPTLLMVIASFVYLMSGIYRDERALRAETDAARAAADAAHAAAARLAEIDEMKDGFVSTVSHELRTPLTSIKGYLEALLEGEGGELTEDQHEFAEIAFRNADRLHALIGDLLTVSRIDSGMLNLKPERLDLEAVVRSVVEELGYVFAASGAEVSIEIDEEGTEVKADRRRVEQVLTNLFSNAVKYSPPGSPILVRIRIDGGRVATEVVDQGIGIPPDELARIGERFFRASTAGTTPGTGLGLAITQRLVELQGGELEVESSLGAGSTFRIVLPMAPRSLLSRQA